MFSLVMNHVRGYVSGLLIVGCITLLGAVGPPNTASAAAIYHTVRPGENLSRIAQIYGTNVDGLVSLNRLTDPNRLRVGQRLTISRDVEFDDPQVHVVRSGETLSGIAHRYGIDTQLIVAWNGIRDPHRISPGQELVVSLPRISHRVRPGENVTTIANAYGVTVESIVVLNELRNPNLLRPGQSLTIPPTGGGVVQALARNQSLVYRRALDRWPAQGTVSSEYGPRGGRMHEGIDIAVPEGTPVRAVAAGRVTYSDWAGTYGMLVMIDHGGGVETRYAHNSRLEVKPGDQVSSGQVIALAGSTGRSTGPHVHFEVRVNGEAINPREWLP